MLPSQPGVLYGCGKGLIPRRLQDDKEGTTSGEFQGIAVLATRSVASAKKTWKRYSICSVPVLRSSTGQLMCPRTRPRFAFPYARLRGIAASTVHFESEREAARNIQRRHDFGARPSLRNIADCGAAELN